MGYTTRFFGRFNLDRTLDEATWRLLHGIESTRRMRRDLARVMPADAAAAFGTEGEFYFGGTGCRGGDEDETVVDGNLPPSTQPGLWCDWRPTADRKGLEWNGAEKSYASAAWIRYLIDRVLAPRGYVLDGSVSWQGEREDDVGRLVVERNGAVTRR